jgi:hypothetical protein
MVVSWVMPSCNQVGGNQCFGGTYCISHILTMEAEYSSETVVTSFQTTRCRNPEDHNMKCKITLAKGTRYSIFWLLVGENMDKCGTLRKVTISQIVPLKQRVFKEYGGKKSLLKASEVVETTTLLYVCPCKHSLH